MSPIDAAKLLDLPADASPEQLEARFNELRAKLEDKIAKAPTPGLKAKYRESLDAVTSAFETLTLAADSSSLPVAQKHASGGPASPRVASAPSPVAPGSTPPAPRSARKSGGREFIIVALIALALLGAGGWFVMKTRAENAEMARVAAENRLAAEARVVAEKKDAEARAEAEKAEQARKVEEARVTAEARRQAEEAEKIRAAAETDRVNKLMASLRSQLAEQRILWESTERIGRTEEQRVSELRNEERELQRQSRPAALARIRAQLAAQENFSRWLSTLLPRHPARIAMVQAEELLSARSPDEAQAALERSRAELPKLEEQIAEQRREWFTLTTTVPVSTEPASVTWTLTDAFGEVHTGQGAREVSQVPFGPAVIVLRRTGYPDKRAEFMVTRERMRPIQAAFASPRITVESIPSGAEVFFNGKREGVTPLNATLPAPQTLSIEFKLAGYRPVAWTEIKAEEGANLSYVATLVNRSTPTIGFSFLRHPDQSMTISGVLPHSPAAIANLQVGDRIDEIFDGQGWRTLSSLENLAFTQLLMGKIGESTRLKITLKDTATTSEVSLERRPRGEIEDARLSAIHYVRGVVLLDINLNRKLEIAGKSFEVGEWNRATVRVAPGRHRLWLEGIGEYFVDVKPGEEVWVRGTMGGWKTLTKAEGERIARKLHHTIGSESTSPAPILP